MTVYFEVWTGRREFMILNRETQIYLNHGSLFQTLLFSQFIAVGLKALCYTACAFAPT